MRLHSLVAALIFGCAIAQQEAFAQCAEGGRRMSDFGVDALLCVGPNASCEINVRGTRGITHHFSVEPQVAGLAREEPDGLRVGDTIVAVDRLLITTEAGGERLARPDSSRTIEVVIRRAGAMRRLQLRTGTGCGVLALSVRTRP